MVQLWRRMRTQSRAFWQDEFEITDEDTERLYASFLEQERPRTIDELATRIMAWHYEQEREMLRAELERGQIYRPEETYQVGQTLVFSALDYALGRVVAVRDGYNPRYAPFQVISVELEDQDQPREFAAGYTEPHVLNLSQLQVDDDAEELSADELYQAYGEPVRELLSEVLHDDPELVCLDGFWFLKSLLPEVHVGHLNLAEAMITMEQRPLVADELMGVLDLPESSSMAAKRFALDMALGEDKRFDKIHAEDGHSWYLFSLEPDAVAYIPWRLKPAYLPDEEELLLGELVEFVRQIDDELDERSGQVVEDADSASFILNYPHRREGTFPLTQTIRHLLPAEAGDRFQISLLTEEGEAMPGWVVQAHRYGWGLGDWYRAQELPVGAMITLSRTDDPWVLAVSAQRQRRTSEWVKEATVQNGALIFGMQTKPLTCKYERDLMLDVSDAEAVDALAQQMREDDIPLFELLLALVPELLKLSSQAAFNAETLYAATNLVRRCGAVPIYAALTQHACFNPMGAGKWSFDPDLKDVIYGTEEEMRERPYAKSEGLIRDVVLPY